MELTTSSVALAVQGLSKEKQKITMVTGAATSDLTGKQCSPYGFHWAYDTHALAVGTGGALVENGVRYKWLLRWPIMHSATRSKSETSRFVEAKGGQFVGAVRHLALAANLFLVVPALQAQSSGANVDFGLCQRWPRHGERDPKAGVRVRHYPRRHPAIGPLFCLP